MEIGNARGIWSKWDAMKRMIRSDISVDLMARSSGTSPRKRMERRMTTSDNADFAFKFVHCARRKA